MAKGEKQVGKNCCDRCGAEVTQARPDKVYSNLWMGMGEYMIKIDITKTGMVTDLCRGCLTSLVTEALTRDNPYIGLILPGDNAAAEARKKKERVSNRSRIFWRTAGPPPR